jgi:hypothetical protein
MRAYSMEGTPTFILIDRQGRLRRQTLGHVSDLRLGAEIMALMMEAPPAEAGAIGPAVDP